MSSAGAASTLLPSVTRLVEATTRFELGPVWIVLATLIVFILSLLTVGSNSIILAAFYRYKRLRTASNCLLVSLAVSDFGVGVFMPIGTYLELADAGGGASSSLCVVPYCILISLCSVSVLVTVAIAVDRLTSLAQPLRYKNIITHSSIEKYIAVFWIYAVAVGLSPFIYAKILGVGQAYGGGCRFNGVIMPPVRVFLFLAVWAPSALILLGCYMYVYLVARAHARAIYTVELSFRNQTQTLALPRYGQTLAVTVGAFFILWLPFQTCMLLDIFCGTNILSDFTIWLGMPILAHSGTNPWIYAFHHGEMRVAAGKIAEDLVALVGVSPSRYGCSPSRRGSHANLELAEVNDGNEERRPPVEDCFAAKHHQQQQQLNISPESAEPDSSSEGFRRSDAVEEDIRDLARMLEPRYAIDRSHVIDSNHNIDKIRNLKYLLDPTFSKIRHLRRLNHKRMAGKHVACRFQHESRFVSYQNLETDAGEGGGGPMRLNAVSDPMLSADSPVLEAKSFAPRRQRQRRKPASGNLASVSDSNIEASASEAPRQQQRRSFGWARARQLLQRTTSPGVRLLEPCDSTRSEPPSPVEPAAREPLDALQEEEHRAVVPSVLLNVEDFGEEPPPDELLLLSRAFAEGVFPEHDSTRFSSRRPSDSRWSESSRSQEVLSGSAIEQPRFPSSYSVNNFQRRSCELLGNGGSSCQLEPFLCSDALSSSLRESFFSAASVPDSEDIFASFEMDEPPPQNRAIELRDEQRERRLRAFFEPVVEIHRAACKLAPLATPTPTDVCTPTFDITVVATADIEAPGQLGVRV